MTQSKKRLLLGAVAAGAALLLAACSSGGSGSSATGSSPKVLGVVALLANDPLNIATINGAKSVADKNGWTIKVTDTQADAAKANAAMTSYATQGVNGIYVLAFATSSIGAGLAAAKSAGIPVASWGGDPAAGIVSTVDNTAVGAATAKALVAATPSPADVLILTFHGGALCVSDGNQFDKYINSKSGYTVTNEEVVAPGQVQSGQSFTTAWLAAHPADGTHYAIVTCWDDPMQGAVAALKQAGRTDVKTFSVNGSAANLKLIQAGDQTASTVPAAFKEGAAAMQNIIDASKAGSSFTPKAISFAPTVITKDNLDQYLKDNPSALN